MFNKLLEYKSIFKHYGVETQSQHSSSEDERNDDLIRNNINHFERKRYVFERNENNKDKKIDAKTINKKKKTRTTTQNSPTKSKKSKKVERKKNSLFQKSNLL